MPVLESLRSQVASHSGEFACSEIHRPKNTSTVTFRHRAAPPDAQAEVPDVPGLRDFYDTWGALTLYLDEHSGDAAWFIAPPSQWAELDDDFRPWIEQLDEDEAAEFVPDWVASALVVGEVPHSGNYLLVATTGAEAGRVFEFEHDGYEFIDLGDSLPDFVARSLDLDAERLSGMASHLRFITEAQHRQWWIEEMRDNRGNVVRTRA